MSKKSQMSMIELFIAAFIFFILLGACLFVWNRYNLNLQIQTKDREMQMVALQLYDQLSKKSGEPRKWEQNGSSVDIVGLVDENRDLSKDKIIAFANLNYTIAKEKLNIKKYEYYLEVNDFNNNTLFQMGVSPYVNNTCGEDFVAVGLIRYLKYQGNDTIIKFILWDDPCGRATSPYFYEEEEEPEENETIAPVIYLINPEDDYESLERNITFSYNVTDEDSEIVNCSLILNSVIQQTNHSITKGIAQYFYSNLDDGDYTWSVNCTDTDNNEGASEIRNLIVNATIPNYTGVPEIAFEEDYNPTWDPATEIQSLDGVYITAYDEWDVMPDYVQFNFPDLGVPSGIIIDNVSLKIIHREDLEGGTLDSDIRHMIRCWDGGSWEDVETYEISVDSDTWTEYYNPDLSGCIDSPDVANSIRIRMHFDPAFDAMGHMDIDFVNVIVRGR